MYVPVHLAAGMQLPVNCRRGLRPRILSGISKKRGHRPRLQLAIRRLQKRLRHRKNPSLRNKKIAEPCLLLERSERTNVFSYDSLSTPRFIASG
jgi:hypothetical protein